MWAEIYGVTNLGAIRSVATSLSILASALGPVIVGGLMDLGVSIERTCLLFAAYTVTGTLGRSKKLKEVKSAVRGFYFAKEHPLRLPLVMSAGFL
jgi:hypothetical protein